MILGPRRQNLLLDQVHMPAEAFAIRTLFRLGWQWKFGLDSVSPLQ